MRKGLVAFTALALTGLGLTGCGLFRFDQREPWRVQAEEACLRERQVTPSAYMSRSSPIDGPGACGISYPFKVSAFGGGTVGLTQKVTLGCPIIPRIDGWIDDVVQPAARLYFGVGVAEVKSGSYSCRPRNNQRGAKLSEHSFGNAIDVMAFRLLDGREVTILRGWRGPPEEQGFLREVFLGACDRFSTVLGPGADAFHYDHLHLDLARHDPRGERRVCKPFLKFEPRLGRDLVAGTDAAPARLATRGATAFAPGRPAYEPPAIDFEEDEGGGVSEAAPSRAAPAWSPPPASARAAPYPAPPPAPPVRAPVYPQAPLYAPSPTYSRAPASAPTASAVPPRAPTAYPPPSAPRGYGAPPVPGGLQPGMWNGGTIY
jgi:hypothetical protein